MTLAFLSTCVAYAAFGQLAECKPCKEPPPKGQTCCEYTLTLNKTTTPNVRDIAFNVPTYKTLVVTQSVVKNLWRESRKFVPQTISFTDNLDGTTQIYVDAVHYREKGSRKDSVQYWLRLVTIQ